MRRLPVIRFNVSNPFSYASVQATAPAHRSFGIRTYAQSRARRASLHLPAKEKVASGWPKAVAACVRRCGCTTCGSRDNAVVLLRNFVNRTSGVPSWAPCSTTVVRTKVQEMY